MKVYYCEQRSKQWYELRCGKLTASNFHCLFSNSWSANSFLLEKAMERVTHKCVQKGFWSEDIQRGIALESVACEAYELVSGNSVKHVGFVELNDYVGSSPDGLVGDAGMIEIKCPNDKNYFQFKKTLHVCPQHYTQMQFNMWVCNRAWCDYVVFNYVDNEPIIVRVERDEEYIKRIAERASEVNSLIDRYGKQLYYTFKTKDLKFRKVGVLSGIRKAQYC